MQKRLFIDRFDGTLKPKTFGQWQLYHLWKCFDGVGTCQIDPHTGTQKFIVPAEQIYNYIETIDLKWLKDSRLKKIFHKHLVKSLESSVKVSHIAAMLKYREKTSENYIFSAPLTKTLCHTKANISLDILPEEPFCYYLEMNGLVDTDGTDLEGILITKSNLSDDDRRLEILYYTSVNRENLLSYLKYWAESDDYRIKQYLNQNKIDAKQMYDNEAAISFIEQTKPIEIKSISIPYRQSEADEKLEAAVRRLTRRTLLEKPSEKIDIVLSNHSKDLFQNNTFRTVINGMLYILSGEEHLKLEHNEFSKKKNKANAQKNIYTSKGFYYLGKNVKFLRDYVEDGYYWAPFFRKSAHSMSNKKTVFVKGHFKYFKNKGKYV